MYKYQLQKYSGMQSRYRCPACNHRTKTFTLYINSQTGQHLASHVGKCDREDKCGYHFTPKMWFEEGGKSKSPQKSVRPKVNQTAGKKLSDFPSFRISGSIFSASLKHYHHNHLITYLTGTLGTDATQKLIGKYHIGTAKHWPGATVFWQMDIMHQVRAGKVMLYDPITGKRVKQPYNHITWVHKLLNLRSKELLPVARCQLPVLQHEHTTRSTQHTTDYQLNQCFFGEHLLTGNDLPVGIVESEKTALIADVLLPGPVWLASGGIGNLNAEHCTVLKGRHVTLYPDVNAYNTWQSVAENLMYMVPIRVSNMLESKATDEMRSQGLDIADCLLQTYKR